MLRNIKDISLGVCGFGSAYLALAMGTPGISVRWIIENSRVVQCMLVLVLIAAIIHMVLEHQLKVRRMRQIQARKKAYLLGTDTPKTMACVKHIA